MPCVPRFLTQSLGRRPVQQHHQNDAGTLCVLLLVLCIQLQCWRSLLLLWRGCATLPAPCSCDLCVSCQLGFISTYISFCTVALHPRLVRPEDFSVPPTMPLILQPIPRVLVSGCVVGNFVCASSLVIDRGHALLNLSLQAPEVRDSSVKHSCRVKLVWSLLRRKC